MAPWAGGRAAPRRCRLAASRPCHRPTIADAARRGCAGGRGRTGRGACRHGAGVHRREVKADDRRHRDQGERFASGPHRVPLRPAVHAAPGDQQHRVDHPPVRAPPTGGGIRLARRADRDHRPRPGAVGSIRRRPGRLPAPGRRGRHGPRWHRVGPGGVTPGTQQRRLAPAVGDLRAHRHADLRRGRPLQPRRVQRPP